MPPRRLIQGVGIAALALGCAVDREGDRPAGGVHPAGWGEFADGGEPAFHGVWLAANQFPLSKCTQCHGADYKGGSVGVSCMSSTCHVDKRDGVTPLPPTACTTCHGDGASPRPTTGAHGKHARFCDTCHVVPTPDQIEQHASGDKTTLIRFGNIATKNAQPVWDSNQKVCSNTYCHGSSSPAWTDPKPLGCDGCHKAPPDNHGLWSRLSSMACTSCHPDPTSDARHVNGAADVVGATCTTCHGSGNHASPPVDLAGGSDPQTRGVGAHARHLDPTLIDRISPVVKCTECHLVPQNPADPEHIGTANRVRLPDGGTYDKQNGTCVVGCHFDRTPGPTWTDNSGAARACDACHGFPPIKTRSNIAHPQVAPLLGVCLGCHAYDSSSHANGVVNLKP